MRQLLIGLLVVWLSTAVLIVLVLWRAGRAWRRHEETRLDTLRGIVGAKPPESR